jgi:hypothetical protein
MHPTDSTCCIWSEKNFVFKLEKEKKQKKKKMRKSTRKTMEIKKVLYQAGE